MGIKFKLLLLLPLVVCTGYPHDVSLPSFIDRVGNLMGDIYLFIIYSSSLNYDAYFVAPVLMSLAENQFLDNGFLDFFAKDFKLADHAKDFHFSETETKLEFAKRFFRYMADAKKVPSKIREIAAKYAKHFDLRPWHLDTRGSISPCPLYSFVRAITFLQEENDAFNVYPNSTELIIKFLLTEFNPQAYDIEENANVYDITVTIDHAFSTDDKPLQLTDGTLASQRNKELFKTLATKESVPQNVKDAIADVLSVM